jgi:hypothetical protein
VLPSVEAVQRTVLPVGLELSTGILVREALAPIKVANAMQGGAGALACTSLLRYDVLVVGFPLTDLPISAFLGAVRKSDSPCRTSGIVLVAPQNCCTDAEEFVSKGANRVVALEELEQGLRPAVEQVVGVAPRFPAKVPVRLEILAAGFARRVFCQTINVSATGMLLRIQHSYPIGTELSFELLVPAEAAPLRGRAEVRRASVQGRGPYPGIGVSFVSFAHEGAERLAKFLHRFAV